MQRTQLDELLLTQDADAIVKKKKKKRLLLQFLSDQAAAAATVTGMAGWALGSDTYK